LLSAAPELFIARMGAKTSKIKLGSGGVLLPQYHPLKVAESFATLDAFYPGRIELGIGNSPGGSERTRLALTDGEKNRAAEFSRLVQETAGFLTDSLSNRHPYRIVKTTPRDRKASPISILGLSPGSAKIAAEQDRGLVFGHFINPDRWEETLSTYREAGGTDVIVCVFVICAPTQEEAERLARTQDAWIQGVRLGNSIVPSFASTEAKVWNDVQTERIRKDRRRAIVGTPDVVAQGLEALATRYQTDQFLLINNAFDQEKRLQSYQLIAERLL